MTRLGFVLLAGVLAGCTPEAPPAPMPDPASVRLDEVPRGAVRGSIGGVSFSTRDARFRVVTRAGRRRVDLFFADRPIERCGLPMGREDVRVWLRFSGRTSLEPGTYALEGEDGAAFDVHYERPRAEGGFDGVHRGVANVELEEVTGQRIRGVARVCFADAEQSCVAGRFDARPCRSRIDGRALREPPGLSDEALEGAEDPAR